MSTPPASKTLVLNGREIVVDCDLDSEAFAFVRALCAHATLTESYGNGILVRKVAGILIRDDGEAEAARLSLEQCTEVVHAGLAVALAQLPPNPNMS